jgi:hypothetical protein
MYVDKVITGLRIFDPVAQTEIIKPEAYFVFEGVAQEAAEFLGVLQAPPHLMGNLVEWLMPEYANGYVLLVSLDGKRGFPFARKAVENPGESERVVHLGTEDDYSAHDLKRLVRDFKLHMRANPDLADEIGYQPTRKVLQPRIAAKPFDQRASVENLDSSIRDAYQSPQWAKCDALIFAFLARENWQLRPEPEQIQHIEMVLREQLDAFGQLGNPGIYNTKGLTLNELEKRRIRAVRNRNAFWRKFPNPWDTELEGGMAAVVRHTSKLSDDELVEMAVVAWYSSTELGAREKSAVIAADLRFAGTEYEDD